MSEPDAVPLPREGEVFFDVRGEARTMRLSWYADSAVAVFSIWHGNRCTGTFRLPFGDLARMTAALQSGPSSRSAKTPGPPGDAALGGRVDPAQGYPQTASYPQTGSYPAAAGTGGYPANQAPARPQPDPYRGSRGYPDGGYPDRGYPDGGYPDRGYPDRGYGDGGYGDGGHADRAYPHRAHADSGHPGSGYPGSGYPERSGYQDRPGYDHAAHDSTGYQDPPGHGHGDYQQGSGHEASRYLPEAADYSGLHSGHSERRYDGGAPFGSRQPATTYPQPDPAFVPGDHAREPADPAFAASREWLTAPTGTTRIWRPGESTDDGQPSPHSEQAVGRRQNTDWEAATASYRAL
jgi:hypothetical protein